MGRGIVSDGSAHGRDEADFVAIGHVTRDVVGDATMVGGAAYYASRTAAALGLRSAMLTSFGADFEHRPELEPLELWCQAAPVSTRFVNRYEAQGRVQHLEALAGPLGPEDLPADLGSVGAVYVCPVMGEVDPALGRAFSARVVGAGAQGWMREVDDRGRVRPRRWRPTSAALRPFDLVVLSDEDAAGDDEVVGHLRDRVRLVAFTHGAAGSELFVADAHHVVPPFATEQVGPTGAGDAFGAALLTGLLWGLEPLEAAYLASCVASVVVEGVGGDALDRVAEAFRRLGPYGRTHGVDVSAIVALAPARRTYESSDRLGGVLEVDSPHLPGARSMASIDIKKDHQLGLATAKQKVQKVAERLESKLGITWTWKGDTVAFQADGGMAKGVKGTIAVTESKVHTQVDLPLLLRAMKGTIEKKVQEELSQLDA